MKFITTQPLIMVLCLVLFVEASSVNRGHHSTHSKKHYSKQLTSTLQEEPTSFDQVYTADFDIKKELQADQADDQLNVYIDKDFSPRRERGAAEFDKYVQTSDQ